MFRLLAVVMVMFFCLLSFSYGAPCYGTKMPVRNEVFMGFATHSLFKRYLENESGKIGTTQDFFLLSYGLNDWLALDLKVGAGNIKQRPTVSDEANYRTNFAGGYGFRLRLYDKEDVKMVCGFQHISVHPKSMHLGDIKHQAILDDWQISFLVSRDFSKAAPYIGTRLSRVDYIHWIAGERKRVMSDLTKNCGLILGIDIPLKEKIWLNLEGQLIDSEAFCIGINYAF